MLLHNQTESSIEPLSRNTYIDGILWGGQRWSDNTITYSFKSGSPFGGTRDWSPEEREVFEAGLTAWEAVTDVEFLLVEDDDPDANFKLNLNENLPDNILGMFHPPGEADAGEGYFNWEDLGGENFANLTPGTLGFLVIIHEIGHGLGLAHPHDSGGGSNLYPGLYTSPEPDNSFGSNGLNQGVWTTMSYNQGFNNAGFQGSPMAFDIAAVQHLYGENSESAEEDSIYTLPRANTRDTYYQSIWDTDGEDSIVAPVTSLNTTIDLRDAPLVGSDAGGYISAVAEVDGGFTIAHGVEIENARGSLGNDELIGNQLANRLAGSDGDDILIGGGGNDTLTGIDPDGLSPGRAEYDQLRGNAGEDTFVLGDRQGAYYQGLGYGFIADFDQLEDDVIQLSGSARDYRLEVQGDDTFIRYGEDIIGLVVGKADLLLGADFRFV